MSTNSGSHKVPVSTRPRALSALSQERPQNIDVDAAGDDIPLQDIQSTSQDTAGCHASNRRHAGPLNNWTDAECAEAQRLQESSIRFTNFLLQLLALVAGGVFGAIFILSWQEAKRSTAKTEFAY